MKQYGFIFGLLGIGLRAGCQLYGLPQVEMNKVAFHFHMEES